MGRAFTTQSFCFLAKQKGFQTGRSIPNASLFAKLTLKFLGITILTKKLLNTFKNKR